MPMSSVGRFHAFGKAQRDNRKPTRTGLSAMLPCVSLQRGERDGDEEVEEGGEADDRVAPEVGFRCRCLGDHRRPPGSDALGFRSGLMGDRSPVEASGRFARGCWLTRSGVQPVTVPLTRRTLATSSERRDGLSAFKRPGGRDDAALHGGWRSRMIGASREPCVLKRFS